MDNEQLVQRSATEANLHYEAIIVGAGFGGMGAAIQLRRLGIESILIYDREADLGGTWHINRYPGIAVDIASVSYSYSFEPNPYWSRLYAPGDELKAYADHVSTKYDLRKHMVFNTVIEKAQYNEVGKFWTVYPKGKEPVTTRILILATGFLSQPKAPDIVGVNRFKGKVIHTAAWDYDVNLGSKAAVIGTGATAVQLIPEIANQLEHLYVYQRTPIWVLPKFDPKIPKPLQKLFARLPISQKVTRWVASKILEIIMVTGVLNYSKFKILNKTVEKFAIFFLMLQVKDPELRRKLTPDYSFGCKRPTFSNNYYKAFIRSNVSLVTNTIDHIEEDAVVTVDGKRQEIDTLILATGFNLWEKGNFPAFEVIGVNGKELGEQWNENHYSSYSGISIPGYPNLFNLHCPYAFNGLSFFSTIEMHMKHIERCINELNRQGATSFEATSQAQDRFMTQMRQNAGNSVFSCGQCAKSNSYYFNQYGEAVLLRLSSTTKSFQQATSYPLSDYKFA